MSELQPQRTISLTPTQVIYLLQRTHGDGNAAVRAKLLDALTPEERKAVEDSLVRESELNGP